MRESSRRWSEYWGSQALATRYFRRLWVLELAAGRGPGEAVQGREANERLRWLVQGHPEFNGMLRAAPFSHFTFQPDGRGNHRFALVTTDGVEHPFSTQAALTGFVKPLRVPGGDPMGGLTS